MCSPQFFDLFPGLRTLDMTLDIDLFRPEKGGNPDKIRENAKRRYDDPTAVDKVVASDEAWRKGENCNS